MATAQDLMQACETARSFGFDGVELVLVRDTPEHAAKSPGDMVRLLTDKGPSGEVTKVERVEGSAGTSVVAVFPLEPLWAWLFHFINGEMIN